MDIDTFTRKAEEMVERIPPPLLDGLTGGIVISEEAQRRDGDPPDVYILGEYIIDIGQVLIVLYYGSFQKLFGGAPDDVIEAELWETLCHEVTHHVEERAGLDDLIEEDIRQLARLHARDPAGDPDGNHRGEEEDAGP